MKTTAFLAIGLLVGLISMSASAQTKHVLTNKQRVGYDTTRTKLGGVTWKAEVPKGGRITIQTMASNKSPSQANLYAPSQVKLYQNGKVVQTLNTEKFSPVGSPFNPGWFATSGYGLKAGTYTVKAKFVNVTSGAAAPVGTPYSISAQAHP